MYWPYLNMRQQELLALVRVAPRVAGTRLIVPIIRPVTVSVRSHGQVIRVAQAGHRVALITNPGNGPRPNSIMAELSAMPGSPVLPTIELRNDVTRSDVASFSARYAGQRCVVIHRDHGFTPAALDGLLGGAAGNAIHVFVDGEGPDLPATYTPRGNHRVLVRNGFRACAPNGAYPPQSGFGGLAFSYSANGWSGFGDFATVGDNPIVPTGGGPANHHAFHLTETVRRPTVVCHHFVSTVRTNAGDRAKYQDSLRLLTAHVGTPPRVPFRTLGVDAFLATRGSGSALAPPKGFSIAHHVEMLHDVISSAGAVPFV